MDNSKKGNRYYHPAWTENHKVVDRFGNEVWLWEVPLMEEGAIEFLDSILNPTFVVFEWGSGASTGWVARRARFVYTVEDVCEWAEVVLAYLDDHGIYNAQMICVPEHGTWQIGPGGLRMILLPIQDERYYSYVRATQLFPNECFDVMLVDGCALQWARLRANCVFEAIPKLKPGGWLMLDDAHRPEYAAVHDALGTWERHVFDSRPQLDAMACFWRKPCE